MTDQERVTEITGRCEDAAPGMLRIHQEMLDIYNAGDADSSVLLSQIADWFNTIKQYWPFGDIPFLLDQLAESQRREKAAERELAVHAWVHNKSCKHYATCYKTAYDKWAMMPCTRCDKYEFNSMAGEEEVVCFGPLPSEHPVGESTTTMTNNNQITTSEEERK